MATGAGVPSEHEIAIGPPLEAVLFITEKDIEAHFRASIEPQLGLKLTHPDGSVAIHDVRWTALSGRLSTEWLRAYPSLSAYAQDELMTCGTRKRHTEFRCYAPHRRGQDGHPFRL